MSLGLCAGVHLQKLDMTCLLVRRKLETKRTRRSKRHSNDTRSQLRLLCLLLLPLPRLLLRPQWPLGSTVLFLVINLSHRCGHHRSRIVLFLHHFRPLRVRLQRCTTQPINLLDISSSTLHDVLLQGPLGSSTCKALGRIRWGCGHSRRHCPARRKPQRHRPTSLLDQRERRRVPDADD